MENRAVSGAEQNLTSKSFPQVYNYKKLIGDDVFPVSFLLTFFLSVSYRLSA